MPSDVVQRILMLSDPTMYIYESYNNASNGMTLKLNNTKRNEINDTYDIGSIERINTILERVDSKLLNIARRLNSWNDAINGFKIPASINTNELTEKKSSWQDSASNLETGLSVVNGLWGLRDIIKVISNKINGRTDASERIVVYCRCSCQNGGSGSDSSASVVDTIVKTFNKATAAFSLLKSGSKVIGLLGAGSKAAGLLGSGSKVAGALGAGSKVAGLLGAGASGGAALSAASGASTAAAVGATAAGSVGTVLLSALPWAAGAAVAIGGIITVYKQHEERKATFANLMKPETVSQIRDFTTLPLYDKTMLELNKLDPSIKAKALAAAESNPERNNDYYTKPIVVPRDTHNTFNITVNGANRTDDELAEIVANRILEVTENAW